MWSGHHLPTTLTNRQTIKQHKDMKREFTDEIKNKVLDLIAEEWLPEDYDYNLTIKWDDEPTIALVLSDGIQVWVINQEYENGQSLATFYMDGDNMACATFPLEIMEVANTLRHLNAEGRLQFAWDYVDEEE